MTSRDSKEDRKYFSALIIKKICEEAISEKKKILSIERILKFVVINSPLRVSQLPAMQVYAIHPPASQWPGGTDRRVEGRMQQEERQGCPTDQVHSR